MGGHGNKNRRAYSRSDIVEEFAAVEGLQPPEEHILNRLGPELRGAAILDLGVGGGRTTPYLTAISQNYVAIDYSPEMIEVCRRRFPGIDFRKGDARDLSEFDDGEFDLVFFSFNGIDYASHDDRLRILREIHRVLRPNGLLVFSSHVLGAERHHPYDLRRIRFTWNAARLAVRVARYVCGVIRHWRLKKYELWAEDYAIINDNAHNFSVLTYYIRPTAQVAQLASLNFHHIELVPVGPDGQRLRTGEIVEAPWVYYVGRK